MVNHKIRNILHLVYLDTCQYCGVPCNGEGHIDHIVPRCLGGSNSLGNYLLSCSKCNQSKNGKRLDPKKEEYLLIWARSNIEKIQSLLVGYDKLGFKRYESPYSKPLYVTLQEEIVTKLKERAASEQRSLSNMASILLRNALNGEKEEGREGE